MPRCPKSLPSFTPQARSTHAAGRCWGLVVLGLFAPCLPAWAAGGHYAVDDAALPEPGQCQLETWVDRHNQAARTLMHLGSTCRLGAVEWGLNLDSTQAPDADGTTTVVGPQIKWAHALTETLSAGVVLGAGWQDRSPGLVAVTLVFPLSWQASETVAFHTNVGRDFRNGAEPDTSRLGVAVEWTPVPAWSFVAERFRESDVDLWRAGARYVLGPRATVDVSRAKGLQGSESAWWTVGLTWFIRR